MIKQSLCYYLKIFPADMNPLKLGPRLVVPFGPGYSALGGAVSVVGLFFPSSAGSPVDHLPRGSSGPETEVLLFTNVFRSYVTETMEVNMTC